MIFDLYQNEDGDLPVEIQVHYRFYPKKYLRERSQHSLKQFYLWDLKQASCIKFEKDGYNVIMGLQEKDSEKLWEFYQAGSFRILLHFY